MRSFVGLVMFYLAFRMPEAAVDWASNTSGYDTLHVFLVMRSLLVTSAVGITVSTIYAK